MSVKNGPAGLIRRLRQRQATVRARLTLLYGGLFLASGVLLLAITAFLAERTFPVSAGLPKGLGSGRAGGTIPGGAPGGTPHLVPASPGAASALISQARSTDLHHLLADCAFALAIMMIVSIALGWLVAGRVLKPLRTITAATQRISEDDLHQRLALNGPHDELKDLSDTIDKLLARLEDAFDAQRLFVANASHELRTPLTVERTLLEMILGDPRPTVGSFRSVCHDVLGAVIEQETLIEALLTLARSQRGLGRREPIDLAAIVSKISNSSHAAAASQGLHIDVSADPAPMAADPRLIERLAANLIDNAIRYNVPDGWVRVLVQSGEQQATLQITNSGPVVPADQMHRLLHPFQRLARDRAGERAGLGLGLSIVAAIAKAHNAVLRVEPGQAGGLTVEVRFPPLALPRTTTSTEPRPQPIPAREA
jgi:signal transduction histidine kinase